jgi:hypothetical protein
MATSTMLTRFGSPLFGIDMLWDSSTTANSLRVTMTMNWSSQALWAQNMDAVQSPW